MHESPPHVMGTVYWTQSQGYENTSYQAPPRLWNTASLSYPDTWMRKPDCLHLLYKRRIVLGLYPTCELVHFHFLVWPFEFEICNLPSVSEVLLGEYSIYCLPCVSFMYRSEASSSICLEVRSKMAFVCTFLGFFPCQIFCLQTCGNLSLVLICDML